MRPRLQAVREEKQTLENDLVRIKREIEIASSADHTLQEHLEGLRQLMAAMASLQGQQRIELRLRLRNEIRRLLERIEVYPEGAARIAGVTGPDNLEIHLYFHSGKFKYVYPRVGALTFPEGYEGEY